ncbi:dynein regulatory complex protein 9 isoform X2 [Brachyhypopomus gauderio]
MPDTYSQRPGVEMVVSANIGAVMEHQRAAELHLKAAREGRVDVGAVSEATRELHRSQRKLSRVLQESPLSPDNLAKIQRDRQFVAQVQSDILTELQEKGTFQSLWQALEEEEKRKDNLQDIIIREEESRLRAKALQKQLLDIRKEKTLELQRREETTAHLKDQLQEMEVKTSLERKYVKSVSELLVYQGQKLNTRQEKELADEIKMLEDKLEEKRRVHTEVESFLKEQQTSLVDKLEYWVECYEKDTENKQHEYNSLRTNKNNNLAQLQELAKKYRESEQVIIEDRLQKEALQRQMEREQLEKNAATKVQSWWRGTMVRKGLGPYKKAKKPKAKERKKGKTK